jgi:hypothetical protein
MNRWLIVLSLLLMVFGGTAVHAASCPDIGEFPLNGCELPGVGDGSFPYFDNNVIATYTQRNNNKFTVRAQGDNSLPYGFLEVAPDVDYLIDNPTFRLDAVVNHGVAKGAVRLGGTIDGERFTVRAKLAGPWATSDDGTLWGFDTTKIKCSKLIDDLTGGCTTDEVVYLALLDAIGPVTGSKRSSSEGNALTSVPLPASWWLMGCGLFGVTAISRRRPPR